MKPFTCLVKKEGNQYTSLCIELDIASCGHTKKEAVQGLKNAVEAYLEYMISENRENEIYRPVPMNALKDFLFPHETPYDLMLRTCHSCESRNPRFSQIPAFAGMTAGSESASGCVT